MKKKKYCKHCGNEMNLYSDIHDDIDTVWLIRDIAYKAPDICHICIKNSLPIFKCDQVGWEEK
jgi:hypothetical protein